MKLWVKFPIGFYALTAHRACSLNTAGLTPLPTLSNHIDCQQLQSTWKASCYGNPLVLCLTFKDTMILKCGGRELLVVGDREKHNYICKL